MATIIGVRPMITTTIVVSGIFFGTLGFLCRIAKRADENAKRT
jgi:hypothetical protein